MPNKNHIHGAINGSFKLLNTLSIMSTIYFSAIIVLRLVGGDSPSIFGIKVDPKYSLIILAICTLLHIGVLRYIIHYMKLAWQHLDVKERSELYLELTGANHLLTQGAEKFRDNIHNNGGFLFVRVNRDDPPSLLHWAMFVVAVVANIQFEISANLPWTFVAAVTLSMSNWQIGSSWLVALADLGRPSEQSLYFDRIDRSGPRYFGIVSGPWHGMNNNIFIFSAVTMLDAILRVLPASAAVFFLWAILETLFWLF